MASVVLPPLADENRLDKQLEQQVGCMAGFLQLFDRQQRIYASKRLVSSGSTSPLERSEYFPSSPEVKPSPTSPLPLVEPRNRPAPAPLVHRSSAAKKHFVR